MARRLTFTLAMLLACNSHSAEENFVDELLDRTDESEDSLLLEDSFVDELFDRDKATESSSQASKAKKAKPGKWDARLEIQNSYDSDWNRVTVVEPTIIYRKGPYRTHLQYRKPVSPESVKGSIEWQVDYKHTDIFRLRHELDYSFRRERTQATVTPRWRFRTSEDLYYGIDLKIDYYDSAERGSKVDIFEVELEPSVNRNFDMANNQRFGIELEAPLFRLYAKDDDDDNLEFVGAEATFSYVKKLNDNARFEAELGIPYDAEDDELETDVSIAIRNRF